MTTPDPKIYRLGIELLGIEPTIHRVVDVAGATTLAGLHDVIQISMGWLGYHLYSFEIGGQRFGEPEPDMDPDMIDDETVTLASVVGKGDRFAYTYDFGDNWEHAVEVIDVFEPQAGQPYPRCVSGERACPPEDCGGPWGYAELLEAIADPKHERHDELTEWLGGEFDANEFDVDRTNEVFAVAAKGRRR